jgi:catechol 2,3-dioxygenase-like lactoylglutathione lyase family enzyme
MKARVPALLTFDHLIIAVADLEGAVGAWSALLGRRPSWRGSHPAMGTRNALYRLGEEYHELLAADPDASAPLASMVREVLGPREERPLGFAIGTADIDARIDALRAAGIAVLDAAPGEGVESTSGARRTWRSALVDPGTVRGLRLLLIEHTSPHASLPFAAPLDRDDGAIAIALDHVVVFTADLAASRDLWVRAFGLEVAWARDFPERGTRNLGLKLGNVILELVERSAVVAMTPPSAAARESPPERERDDFVWGAAWRVGDCARAVTRIGAAGLAVDAPRPGLESGTTVATVRWPRSPTLLRARP